MTPRRTFGIGILIIAIAAFSLSSALVFGPAPSLPTVCNVEWVGSTDEYMLAQVKKDFDGHCDVVRAQLMSFGGPVHTSIAIAQELRRAQARGVIVELHGRTVVVSGGVIVLAAGSKGNRFVDKHSITMVHAVQRSQGWGANSCAAFIPSPQTEDDKFTNRFIELVAEDLAISSGRPLRETMKWLECGNEQVGNGALLVKLGLADALE